jgi:hypothetical protein
MKRILKTLLPGLALLMMVSCDKYEGPDLAEKSPVSMDNTSWVYIVKDSVPITHTNEEGEEEIHNVDRTTTNYILFETKKVGVLKTEIVSKMHPRLNSDTTVNFKYDYTRPTGVLYYQAKDALGYTYMADVPFQASWTELTIDWGAGAIVYTRRLDQ